MHLHNNYANVFKALLEYEYDVHGIFLRNFTYPTHFSANSLPFFRKILINPSSRRKFAAIFLRWSIRIWHDTCITLAERGVVLL